MKGSNKVLKQVFLDNLPRWGDGRYKGKINWKECINTTVEFIYDDIKGEFKIIDYKIPIITLLYNEQEFKIATYSFLKNNIGVIIGKINKNYLYNANDIVNTNSGQIKIIEQMLKKRKNGDNNRWYKYQCMNDGYIGEIQQNHLCDRNQGCPVCSNKIIIKGINDIATTHPDLIKYFYNIEDSYKYSYGSETKAKMICPDCGYAKQMRIADLFNKGFSCPMCNDTISYPEKFMSNLLKQTNTQFITQFSPKWSRNKRYDFYIPSLKCIIETHGEQHYKTSFATMKGGRSLAEEQENDKLKERLAIENGIKNYIVIDCSRIEWKFIKDNIFNSNLSILLNLNNIDWLECHKYGCCNFVKKVSDLWNSGIHNNKMIGNILNLHHETVRRHLKMGRDLNWNDYNEYEATIKGAMKRRKIIICLNTLEKFNGSKEVEKKYNIQRQSILKMCKHNEGNYISVNNKPYVFMYYDDYLSIKDKTIIDKKIDNVKLLFNRNKKKFICINTLEIFSSNEAIKYIGHHSSASIINCCKGKYEWAGKHPITGEPLKWMYYENYIKTYNTEINQVNEIHNINMNKGA